MLKLDRRQALGLLGASTLTTPAVADAYIEPVAFSHGVASGDPLHDRVVIWTAVTTSGSRNMKWEVSETADFRRVVRKGSVRVPPGEEAYDVKPVKVDVTGLKPGRDYYYRFSFKDIRSPVGRTRTLPKGPTEDVVLAAASCALWPGGFFNAYEAIAKLERVDAVVHLGDYIYEFGPDGFGGDIGAKIGRIVDPPREILSLDDYRRRHAQVKSDPKLQAAHARAPWIVVWDDHETANDSWVGGAENHTPATEGGWTERKANALRAWYEWMPIRDPEPGRAFEAINRSFHFGDLASLIMVETRLAARSHPIDYAADLVVDGKPDPQGFGAKLMNPARTMMGEKQEAWLAEELAASVRDGKRWQVLGNQVVMAKVPMPDVRGRMTEEAYAALLAAQPPFIQQQVVQAQAVAGLGLPFNLDAWDGYPPARERVYAAMKAAKATPIVLSGDSHAFWANNLHDAGGQRVAVEFGTTGITSPGFGVILPGAPIDQGLMENAKEVVFSDQSSNGFVLLTLTPESAIAEMVMVSTVFSPEYETKLATSRFHVRPADGGIGEIAMLTG